MNRTNVIAISGTMGSGKSTLVEHLADALPDCEMVFEDHFNQTMDQSLDRIESWWSSGADVGQFELSDLVHRLKQLCPDKHSDNPSEASPRRPGTHRFVLLETQFGRLHPDLAPWIDFQCWIEVPADIAVMRKLMQFTSASVSAPSGHHNGPDVAWIHEFCRGYLCTTRKLFEMQRHQVRNTSDASVDGLGTPLDVCSRCISILPMKYKPEF